MGICSPDSLPLYTVMFDAILLSDLANKFSLSLVRKAYAQLSEECHGRRVGRGSVA